MTNWADIDDTFIGGPGARLPEKFEIKSLWNAISCVLGEETIEFWR